MTVHDAGASGRSSYADHGESRRHDLRDHGPAKHGPHRHDDDPDRHDVDHGHRRSDHLDPHHLDLEHHDPQHHGPAPVPPAADGMIAVLGGSAAAAGDDTAAAGSIETFAEDRGGYSIATGEAIFEAMAHSAERGWAAATADTFLSVSGADFVFEWEVSQAGHGPHDATARSELDFLSIDVHGWSPPNGPIVIDMSHMGHGFDQHLPFGQGYGNVAMALSTAEAHGVDSLAATLTDAFTVENRFSFVTATGIVAV